MISQSPNTQLFNGSGIIVLDLESFSVALRKRYLLFCTTQEPGNNTMSLHAAKIY